MTARPPSSVCTTSRPSSTSSRGSWPTGHHDVRARPGAVGSQDDDAAGTVARHVDEPAEDGRAAGPLAAERTDADLADGVAGEQDDGGATRQPGGGEVRRRPLGRQDLAVEVGHLDREVAAGSHLQHRSAVGGEDRDPVVVRQQARRRATAAHRGLVGVEGPVLGTPGQRHEPPGRGDGPHRAGPVDDDVDEPAPTW